MPDVESVDGPRQWVKDADAGVSERQRADNERKRERGARPVEDRPLAAERLQGDPPEIVPDPPAAELLGRLSDVGPALVCGPSDGVLINVGPGVDQASIERVRASVREWWPHLADRVLIISAEQIAVIET